MLRRILSWVPLSCLAGGLVWADCVDGMRPMTAAEKQTYNEVTAAINGMLAPPPDSWKYYGGGWGPGEARLGQSVCRGSAVGSFFPLEAIVSYRYVNPPAWKVFPEDVEAKKLSDEITALQRLPDDVRKQYNDIQAQQSEKRRASRASERAGNKDEARSLLKEADEISKGADKVRKDYLASIAPQVKEREAKIKQLMAKVPKRDTEVHINVAVNQKDPIPAETKGLDEDIYVWGSKAPAKPGLALQNVVLRIAGYPDFRQIITARLDLSKLSALVKK